MRRLAVAALAAATLVACAGSAPATTSDPVGDPGNHHLEVVTLPVNGTLITCVAMGWNDGGISCDWQGWHEARLPK